MKTIKELSVECGVHRTTLNKAVQRGAIPARRSGTIILIDEGSPKFRAWLVGRSRTSPTVPDLTEESVIASLVEES